MQCQTLPNEHAAKVSLTSLVQLLGEMSGIEVNSKLILQKWLSLFFSLLE